LVLSALAEFGNLPDDAVLDLGGGVTMTAIPTPGHTRGHTAWLIEPCGVLVIGDIDLSSFGPYYADAVSNLEEFVASMATIRDVEAAWYVTFHHKGVVEGHDAFVEALDAFAAVVDRRDDAIVEYCREPRSIADMAEHRFLYRPHVELPWVASAERRTAEQHVERLLRTGRLVADGDRYVRAGTAGA
jgi:glyoxylase-like metal-dependent hydrolase (beta-lactamase superfamily II)